MSIKEDLSRIEKELESELSALDNLSALDALRVKVLGKKGSLTALLRGMGQLSADDRPKMGQLINEGSEKINYLLDEKTPPGRTKSKRSGRKRNAKSASNSRPWT